MRHGITVIAAFLIALASLDARARDGADVSRAEIQAERRSIVEATMKLDQAQAGLFWPLYQEYRDELAPVNEQWFELIDDYTAAYETLTDAQASEMLDRWLGIEHRALEVRQKWVRRFRKALPARVVARYFQLDNKLDAVIREELARVIPLARAM